MRILYVFFVLVSNAIYAQSSAVSEAFLKSYEYEYNKEYGKAIESLTAIYNPKSYETNLRLGWLTFMNQDYMKSRNYYLNAVKVNPSSIEARLGLANPLAAINNWDEVIQVYEEILEISEKDFTANYRLALIYYGRKKFNLAHSYAVSANQLYPFDYNTNLLLGKINVSLGNITKAKEYLNKALLYAPTSTEVQSLLKVL